MLRSSVYYLKNDIARFFIGLAAKKSLGKIVGKAHLAQGFTQELSDQSESSL
jgi:hypothetical protein